MKTFSLITTALLFTITSFGQDANYKGPGKVEVQSFWRQAEIFKNGKGSETNLGNMKRSLENLKQKDPAYNAGAMEAELKKWQAEIDKKLDAEKSPEQKAADAKSSDYTGAAKSQVKYFWDRALKPNDKLSEGELNVNIRDMEYALKTTKEKDPAYDASEMEAALKKIKDDLKSIKAGSK